MLMDLKDSFGEMELLAGTKDNLNKKSVRAFHQETILLLSEVSNILMANQVARSFPDVITFAFWCRKANITQIAKNYSDAINRMGRGVVLHITPSNVPVNFAFSWAFSQLAGNVDIVRVPSRPFPQVDLICQAIDNAMKHTGVNRSIFVRYSVDSGVTESLSEMVDARVLWGGDETVSIVRKMPCKPRCIDVVFPDRYSIAIVDADGLAEMNDEELINLVDRFYNDVFVLDQNACSSPRVLYWLNTDYDQRRRFISFLRAKAYQSYELQGAVSIDKYVRLCEDAAKGLVIHPLDFDGYLTTVLLDKMPTNPNALRGYGGYLYEANARSLEHIFESLDSQCQSAVCIGIKPEIVRELIISGGYSCIDRVVGVGHAMEMAPVWDGFDLPRILSRLIKAD